MKLRELIILEVAGGGGAPAGPGGPPSGDPAPSTPAAASTGKIGDAPPGGGQGLSGQGTLKSAGVFIGHETPEQKHDYTAKSVVGKGIEWTKPTGSTTSEKVDKETELEMPGEHHTVGHDSEGVTEEAEASSTVNGDIATVAYPLFVRGKNNKDKRKNARAAVGQKYVPGPKGIGTGVFEGSMPINHATGVDWFDFATWALKQGDKYKDLTTNYAVYQAAKKEYKAYVKAKQTGMAENSLNEFAPGAGDEGGGEDPYKYPKPEHFSRSIDFFGQFEAEHFDREDMNDATGEFKGYWGKNQIAYFKFDNPARTGSDDPGIGWYYEPDADGNGDTASAEPAVDNSAQRKQQELSMIDAFLKSGQTPKPGSQIHSLMKRHGMAEAAASSQYAKLYHSTPLHSLDAILQSGYLAPSGNPAYLSLTRDSKLDYGSWAGSDSFVEFDIDQNAVRQRIKLEPYNHSATMGGPRATGGGESEERTRQKLPLKGFVTAMHAPTGWEGDKAGEHYGNLLKKYGVPIIYDIVPKLGEQGVEEAHVLNHDNVIYRLDRENPMSDTEVAVLGGAGRYSLKGLRDKARREAAELAQDLSVEHGGAFRRSATNIKQLTNTINTIVAAYNELARLRRKGGRGSRGITDEDANFIRECIRVVEQATQNYRLMEGLTKEPDPKGYAKDNLTSPKYTIVVNTPGDLDWYKIGTYWNNKIIDPHEFGQDDSDTVMVAQGEEEYKEMLAKINKMGLTYKTIGGTNAQPEIHDKA